MVRMTYDQIKQNALALTSLYETSSSAPACFGVASGNFDGAGMSFGAIQFNIKSNTLQPILKRMFEKHTDVIKTAFAYSSNSAWYNTLYDQMYNKTNAQQITWANSITNTSNKHKLIEPWATYFKNLGVTAECIAEQMVSAQPYFDNALAWFNKYKLFSRRGYALMFDIAVQSGGISTATDTAINSAIALIKTTGKTKEQIETEKMVIIANKRADAVTSTFQTSYRQRKLSIANGTGWVYSHTLYMDTNRYGMTLEEAFPYEWPVRVYIDAGYGGADLGGTFADGTLGKNITLDIALKLRNILQTRYTGLDVTMSRTSDIDKSLIDRANEAKSWGATYVVSIRLGSDLANTATRGFESLAVNNFVNPPDSIFWVQGLVHTAIQAYVQWPTDLGKAYLHDALVDNLTMKHIVTLNGFVTNTADQALLLDDAFRTKIAEGHAKGLMAGFSDVGLGEVWEKVDKSKHVFGADMSSYQNVSTVNAGVTTYSHIDFNKAKSQGAKFVYLRAVGSDHGVLVNGKYQVSLTDTTLKKDPTFAMNSRDARSSGLAVGAYYFANANSDTPVFNKMTIDYQDFETFAVGSFKGSTTVSIDTAHSFKGTKSLKFLSSITTPTTAWLGATTTDYNIDVVAGASYIISFYAYSDADASVNAQMKFNTTTPTTTDLSIYGTLPANMWKKFYKKVTVPANCTKAILRLDNLTANVNVWMDGIMMEDAPTGNSLIHGVAVGGTVTCTFKPNISYTNLANSGEIMVDTSTGTSFTHPNGTVYTISTGKEITTNFETGTTRTGTAYIMFVGSYYTGRINKPTTYSSTEFIVAFYKDGQWYQDANGTDIAFTPVANDCIVGEVGRTATTITGINAFTMLTVNAPSSLSLTNSLLTDATNQANHFADILEETYGPDQWGDLYPFVDFERYAGMTSLTADFISNWLTQFKLTFETRIPTKLGLYTGFDYLKEKKGFNSATNTSIANMPLWIANYAFHTDPFNHRMVKVGTWDTWTIWQYASDTVNKTSWGIATANLDTDYSKHLSYLRKPLKPQNVRVDYIDNQLRFNWDKQDDQDIARFSVYKDGVFLANVDANKNYLLDANVITDRIYSYKVQAIDLMGEMTVSDEITVTVEEEGVKNAPAPPSNVHATAGYKLVDLAWTKSTDAQISGYNIYQDGKWVAWVNGETTSYQVTGLELDVTYSFTLDASSPIYPNISIQTTPESATPFLPIETPNIAENVNANVEHNLDVTITWENVPKLSFSHFAIAINGEITYNNLQDKTFTLTDWPVNTLTRVNILVYNIINDVVWSNDVYFTIQMPSSPQGLVATPNDHEIALKWIANTEPFVKGYNLYLDDNFIAFVTDTSYLFQTETISKAVSGPTENETFTSERLTNGKIYRMGVQAVSTQSDIESTITETTGIPIRVFPNAPTYVAIEVVAENEIKISWQNNPKDRFSHFAIAYNDQIIADNLTSQVFNYVFNFPVRTELKINVISYDTDGDTTWSQSEYFRIEKPSKPLGLNVGISDRKLTASWFRNNELYITGYNVYLNGTLFEFTDKATSTITGLTNGTLYSITVQAVGDTFNSDISDAVTGTPVLDIPNVPRISDYRILGTGEVELTIEHAQKIDHSHYEVFMDGSTEVANTSPIKSISTPTLIANETYVARIRAVDLDGDVSALSEPFECGFTGETLAYIRENTLALGQIDETLKPVIPTVYLCKPNKQTIGVIAELKALNYIVRLGDLNELSFTIPFLVDREGEQVDNPIIGLLKERYLLRLELNGDREYFLINNFQDTSDTSGEIRNVHAFSLGFELGNYQIASYEKVGYAKEVLEEVLADTPWQLSTRLKDITSFFNTSSDAHGSGGRSFSVSSVTVLDYVKQVASAFGAVIEWNTETRSIDFKQTTEVGENRGFRISYDKYLKSLSQTVNADEMVTRFYPIGADNLNIREINPTQSPYIDDLSYFLYPFERDENGNVIQSSNYMSDDLAGAILDYQVKFDGYKQSYADNYQSWKEKEREKTAINNELTVLKTNRDIVQGSVERLKLQDHYEYHEFTYNATPYEVKKTIQDSERWVAICKVSDATNLTVTCENVAYPVVAETWTILGRKSGITEINVNFTGTNPNVYVELYFIELLAIEFDTQGNDQDILDKYLLELSQAKVDAKQAELTAKQIEIDNVNQALRDITFEVSLSENFTKEQIEERKLFLITKEWSNTNISNAEELYNEALKEFAKLRSPQIQITIDVLNFLGLIEAQNDWDLLQIGDVVKITDERLKVDYSAKILEINFSYDDNAISLTIASADEIKSDQEKFMDSLYKAISTSTTVESKRNEWDKVTQNTVDIQSWLDDEFDASKKKIIAGVNESIEISSRGLLIKDKDDKENFLVAQHKVIAITNDGGKTYKNAITVDGVIAERLVGTIVAGENLVIESENGSFKIDRDGILIKSFALKIEGGMDERNLGIDSSGIKGTYQDWNKGNIDNDSIPNTPTISVDGNAIDHIDLTDDTIDISFSWDYDNSGAEGDIDGFMVFIHASSVSESYDFGTSPSRELQFNVNPLKRSIVIRNVSKYLYYTFGVQAYRMVNTSIDVTGVLLTGIVQPQLREEKPYYPYVMKGKDGSIFSTVDPNSTSELSSIYLNAIRQGVSYNNVTIDANVGLLVRNSQDTARTVMNATEGIAIYTRKDPSVNQFDRVFYVDTNGRLTAEKLIAKALEIYDKNGRKIIDANEGVLNLRNLNRIEGQETLNKVTIGAETVFESGYNPKSLSTLFLVNTPVWNSSFVYHKTALCGLHLQANGDCNISSCKMYSSGTNSGSIVLKRKDTGETIKIIDITLVDGENVVVLDMDLTRAIGSYWLGIGQNWSGNGVSRNTNTVIHFPYNAGDFVIVDGGTYDNTLGSGYYYYFYDFLVSGKGVKGYVLNDITLEAIRVKGSTLINGNYIQTGTVRAEALVLKGLLDIRKTNPDGSETTTFSISSDGTVTVNGNIIMNGGNIAWGLDPANQNVIKGFSWMTDVTDNVQKLFINADYIKTGQMSFDRAGGGTLTLGGLIGVNAEGEDTFQNGILSVLNSNGEEIAQLNGDYGGFGQLRIDKLKDTKNIVFQTDKDSPNINDSGQLVYYVDPQYGNDDLLTTGEIDSPFATVQEAIDRLPKYLDRDVIINVKPVLLADSLVYINGFVGRGKIVIQRWAMSIRYVRDWITGNTVNSGNHWVELEALRTTGAKITMTENNVFTEYLDNYIANANTNLVYINGIVKGGIFTGEFQRNVQSDGTANNAEIRIDTTYGNRFFHPNGTIFNCETGGKDVSTSLEDNTVAKSGYLAFIGSDKTRFTFPYPTTNNHDFLVVYYEGGQWKYDNNTGTSVAFTPNANDCLVATVGRSTSTALGIDIFTEYEYQSYNKKLSRIVDGDKATANYYGGEAGATYVRVYLNGIYTDIAKINIWHYYYDTRMYHSNTTQVSEDNNKWYTVFDSNTQDEYTETSSGHTLYVNKILLNGRIQVDTNSCEVEIRDFFNESQGVNMPSVYGYNTNWFTIKDCIINGDLNYPYTVYCSGSNMRVLNNEINFSSHSGIISAYGGRCEVVDCVGGGFLHGMYAFGSGLIGGYGKAPLGSDATTPLIFKVYGGTYSASHTGTLGELSPATATTTPPPPAPKTVTRTKTWTSSSGDSWNEGANGWHTSDNDVLQGKYSSYGLYRGLWFFPSDMRNTCSASTTKSITKVRVYMTRMNTSGNVSNANHQLRTHGYLTKPSTKPTLSSDYKSVVLDRGQSMWVDVTSLFASDFKAGTVYGMGIYTTSTSSSYYTRCSNVAKIEITYTETV